MTYNNPSSQQSAETLGTVYSAAIQPKHNTTSEVVPLAEELIVGEIAVNTADGKLFVKHSDDTIKEISGSDDGGGAVQSVNGQVGVVDLGIQDMNDYAPVQFTDWYRYLAVTDETEMSDVGAGRITNWLTSMPEGLEDQYITIDETDADGKSSAGDPNWPEPTADGNRNMYYSLDGAQTWIAFGNVLHFGNVPDPGPARLSQVGVSLTPRWTAGQEIYIAFNNDPTPEPLEQDQLLVYNASNSKFQPGQTKIEKCDDFSLVYPPVGAYTYTMCFSNDNINLSNDQNEAVLSKANSKFRFNRNLNNDFTVANMGPIVYDAQQAHLENNPDLTNFPFWLKNEQTGAVVAHVGSFQSGTDNNAYVITNVTPDLDDAWSGPLTYTLYFGDPVTPNAKQDADVVMWDTTTGKYRPEPLRINGQAGPTVDLGLEDMNDVTRLAFNNYYYYEVVADSALIDGTNAYITTDNPYGSGYMLFDAVDANGRDIRNDGGFFPPTGQVGAPAMPIWISLDNGVTFDKRLYGYYGSTPTGGSETIFSGVDPASDPAGPPPGMETSNGTIAMIALSDPAGGQPPVSGDALVSDGSNFAPKRVVSLEELQTIAAASADFAAFKASIAALQ